MKTKKLLMMLSAMATLVAGSSAKAETENGFHFPFDQQKDVNPMSATSIFKQDELARIPVNGSYVSIVKGWQAGTKVETVQVEKEIGGETYNVNETVTNRIDAANLSQADRVWTVPFIAHDGNMRHGFAKAWSDDTVGFLTNGIAAVTYNPDSGKMYFFENHNKSHDHFWEVDMNLGAVTATEPVAIIGQLNPQSTEIPFYSGNSDMSDKLSIRADRAFSFGKDGVGSGEWIVTYDSSAVEGDDNTVILHRNGVVNQRHVFDGIEPREVTIGDDKVYVSNGTNLYSMDKANPTNGYEMVANLGATMSYGIVGDDVYLSKSDGIYLNGQKGYLFDPKSSNDITTWERATIDTDIKNITNSNDGRLVLAYSVDADTVEIGGYLRFSQEKDIEDPAKTTPVVAVRGAQKIISAKDGVIKVMTKAGQEKVLTYTKE